MNFLNRLLQGIAFIPSLVTGIERIVGSNSGAEKKDAAISFLQHALGLADAAASREIVNPEKFQAGLGMVINGIVECLNASAWAKRENSAPANVTPIS